VALLSDPGAAAVLGAAVLARLAGIAADLALGGGAALTTLAGRVRGSAPRTLPSEATAK
jgi:hypothetical protein